MRASLQQQRAVIEFLVAKKVSVGNIQEHCLEKYCIWQKGDILQNKKSRTW
jgi:hypothetical protein